MQAKVTILSKDPCVLKTVDAEIPDRCPNCKADLTKPGAMRAGGYVWHWNSCHVRMIGKEPTVCEDDESESDSDSTQEYTVSFICNPCGHELAGAKKS